MRWFILFSFMTLHLVGCAYQPPIIQFNPPQTTPTNPPAARLDINVGGKTEVSVVGSGVVGVQACQPAAQHAGPGVGAEVCTCLCGKEGCLCQKGNNRPLQAPAPAPRVYLYSLDGCEACVEWEHAITNLNSSLFVLEVIKGSPPPWVRSGSYEVPVLVWRDAKGVLRHVPFKDWQGASLFLVTWQRSMGLLRK